MTRPYSIDLRERVVAAVQRGETTRSVAARFGVAVSTVVKWHQRYRETGSVAPGKMGGYRRRVLEPYREFITDRLEQTPHLTLHRLKDELAARGIEVSHNTVWQFLRREGLRFKKTLFALEQGRSDVARHRRRWKARRAVWIPPGSSSSTRPGSEATWRRCAAGGRKASACAASPPRDAGAP